LAPKPVKSVQFTRSGSARAKPRSDAGKPDRRGKATQSSLF